MKTLLPALLSIGLALVPAVLVTSCQNTDFWNSPEAKAVGRVTSQIALQRAAAELREKDPEAADALLLVLDEAIIEAFSAPADGATLAAWPVPATPPEAIQLEADVRATLDSLPEAKARAVLAAVKGDLRPGSK